jgi:hypothetical protein
VKYRALIVGQFIAAATGRDFGVGHGLQSHTSQMTAIRVKRGNSYVVLVDTPGFDDTYLSDYDILKLVSDWLRETCVQGTYSAWVFSRPDAGQIALRIQSNFVVSSIFTAFQIIAWVVRR